LSEPTLLLGTAATLGFLHTLLGPDHYVPFIAMSRVRGWSLRRTLLITILCSLGHILSSVAIGLIGLAFGIAVLKLEAVESARGEIAAWLLLGFGLAYMIWGIRHASKKHTHRHLDSVTGESGKASITPWIIFTIFIFGPCEPLIPILMYPAATQNLAILVAVVAAFGLVTMGTMLALVLAGVRGVGLVRLPAFERYSHALAGFVVLLCGAGIKFLGL